MGGGVYDHAYNWLGAAGGSSVPTDDSGHGTHTLGIMLGDDGAGNQIGVAPGAQWIACDGCESGYCPGTPLLTCAQWLAAPYPPGQPDLADPDRRPHVVNNSWTTCGQTYDDWFQGAVDSWHAAGIYPIFAAGNASNCGYSYPPGCNTVGNPARYGNVTAVGATGRSDGQYASYSTWGPTDDPDALNPGGYPQLKPQVVAPGSGIRSSLAEGDTDYGTMSGTSMAAPHVAGLVALMWNAAPCLAGDYGTTETILETTAAPIPYATGCGGEGPGDVPNMATGWGEIDALAAVQEAASRCTPDFTLEATPDSVDVCAGDGAVYDVAVGSVNNFGDPVTLSLSGEPAGTSPSFSPNPIGAPGSSVLTLGGTGSAAGGSYSFEVVGTSGALTHRDAVALNVYEQVPTAPSLAGPADGSLNQAVLLTFAWSSAASAASYGIEIATDPGLANVVASADGLAGTSYTPGLALAPGTVYYWRVWANNPCGPSSSPVWAFRTEVGSCTSHPSSDVPKAVDNKACVDSTLYLDMSLSIDDVDVIVGQITHPVAEELDIYVVHPDTTQVELSTDNDGSGDNYVDTVFNDQAATPITAGSPPFTGSFRPEGSLDALDGRESQGTWTLRVCDDTPGGGFSGSLESWGLEICASAAAPPADYSDFPSSYGAAWHEGDGSLRLGTQWDADTTFALSAEDGSDDGVALDPSHSWVPGATVAIHVTVQGGTTERYLAAWFDWDDDGAFYAQEQALGETVSEGLNVLSVTIPSDGGYTDSRPVNARFRLYPAEPAAQRGAEVAFGAASGGEAEDHHLVIPLPTAVEIVRFEAEAADGGALFVEWETGSEVNNLGFHLYRSAAAAAPRTRLNGDLIPGQAPGSPVGGVYNWRDEDVVAGATYFYWLAAVDSQGQEMLHGPLAATAPAGGTVHRCYLPWVVVANPGD